MPLTDVVFVDGEMEISVRCIVLPLDVMRKADECGELLEMIRTAANSLDLSGQNVCYIEEDTSA